MEQARRELLEERWHVLMTDAIRTHEDARPATGPSARYRTIRNSIDELATLLVGDVLDGEADSLNAAIDSIWDDIHDRLMDWAETIESTREDFVRRTVAAE